MNCPPVYLHSLPFLSRLLGGGLPPGLIGLVGPTGSGKTCLGVQIAVAAAQEDARVLYINIDGNNMIPWRSEQILTSLDDDGRIAANIGVIDQPASSFRLDDALFNPFDLLILDQLVPALTSEQRLPTPDEISRLCDGLKQRALQTGATILLLHQAKAALSSASPLRMPEITDAMGSRRFAERDVDTALFLGTRDSTGLCRLACPAKGVHELLWLQPEPLMFRDAGPEGTLFEGCERAGTFVLTPDARQSRCFSAQDLFDPAENQSAPSLDWDRLYTEFHPDLLAFYARSYEQRRNQARLPGQLPYQLNPRRYAKAFWKTVYDAHRTHGFSFMSTLEFVFAFWGRDYCPWPDLLGRIPGMLRTHQGLHTDYQIFLRSQRPDYLNMRLHVLKTV